MFKISSSPWTSDFDGELLSVGGHLHDGGLTVTIYRNSRAICTSRAKYGVQHRIEDLAGTLFLEASRIAEIHS